MSAENFTRQEKDIKFKKKYLAKSFWLKTPAIYPATSMLFLALLGLIYLLNSDMLMTVYAIPFILFFLLGTIWLKATKRQVLKMEFEKENAYLICEAAILEERAGWVYTVFTMASKRHNKHYIQNVAKDLMQNEWENISFLENSKSKKSPMMLENREEEGENRWIKAFPKSEFIKKNRTWEQSKTVPIVFVNGRIVFLMKP